MKQSAGVATEGRPAVALAATTPFSLEVWKAQQQARFRAQLRDAKAAIEKRVRDEMLAKEKQQMHDLEQAHAQLETMAQRLRAAGEALQRRTLQFEAREAAFEARRTRVAEQHEYHLTRVEDQARRALEEANTTQATLRAQLEERDRVVQQLQNKLRTVEGEFETLRRHASRQLSTYTDVEGDRWRGIETQLTQATARVRELEAQQVERTTQADALLHTKLTLAAQLQRCQDELAEVKGRLSRLQERWYNRERDILATEAERLEQRRRELQVAGPRIPDRVLQTDVLAAHTVVPATQSPLPDTLTRRLHALRHAVHDALATPAAAADEGDGVKDAICPVKRHVSDSAGAAPSEAVQARRLVYAERAAPRLKHKKSSVPATTAAAPALRDGDGADRAVAPSPPPSVRSATARPSTTTSANSLSPLTSASGLKTPLAHISADDSSLDSYAHVEIDSWHSEAEETTQRPPLATVQRRSDEVEAGTMAGAPAALAPRPEDFVQATQHAESTLDTMRADMLLFVEQLKANRCKLLETGVYDESHSVVREMAEKIALYEQYLAEHL